ncbi:HalOD1 output domain-containing protein [Halosimplex amylolyticum]|uniref:HalOD1 output domain-containing protein n=1 Tax=Halosimplex amylolyticum TaxID=3396616 RepID=UPI003F572911
MDGMAVHDAGDQISLEVIETIANVTDADPLTMEPPLYDVVDTDALDSLYQNGAEASVEFEYNGYTIAIDGDRTVTVDGEGA